VLGDLDLKRTLAESEGEEGGYVLRHLGLEDDIVTCYPDVDVAFSDEGGDISGGEEDESDRLIRRQRYVESGVTTELDVSSR
jgi:hypothetical protein